MNKFVKLIENTILATLLLVGLAACGGGNVSTEFNSEALSYDDAVEELAEFTKTIPAVVDDPILDIYDESTDSTLLASLDTFPLTVENHSGQIELEIAAPSEITGSAPDDWLNVVAERFNSSGISADGKVITVNVRRMSSGEVITYMTDGNYRPDLYIPSSYILGKMIEAKGFNAEVLTDRLLGNTAGILMDGSTYTNFVEKYGEVTVDKVLEANLAGDLSFAYTNPYTSATGINILTAMLHAFDPDNPLSDAAEQKLLDYQRQSPPVAYTTGILRDQAAKGIITAMVMEEQAFVNTPELASYVYTPAGVRHDHPVYTFNYVSAEKREAAQAFVDYCLGAEAQDLATQKGFNLHNDYQSQDPNLDGLGYLAAQHVWKQNKDGGKPILAVFVADVSGSMEGLPLNSLKDSLLAAAKYIGEDNYVGLVSFAGRNDIRIGLPLERFDATHRAYFSGAVKNLSTGGSTATYDATLVAAKMLLDKQAEVPDAKMMLFVLSDGEQNDGYTLSRIAPIIGGLRIPVYTIGYNLDGGGSAEELARLSGINEAATISADSDDLMNQLRNLFNVQL